VKISAEILSGPSEVLNWLQMCPYRTVMFNLFDAVDCIKINLEAVGRTNKLKISDQYLLNTIDCRPIMDL